MRGDGRVFLRRGTRWWISYYVNGGEQREPALVADANAPGGKRPAKTEPEARRALKVTMKAIHGGAFISPQERRVTVGELLDDLMTHLRNMGRRSVDKLSSHVKAVREFFGGIHAANVTTPLVERFTAERLDAGKARATVNRELEGLKRAFTLAAKRTPPRVSVVPYIPLLRVENARQGFLSRADFEALLRSVTDPDLRDFIEWGFWTGMRKGEVAKLTWEMLDRETWTLRLHGKAAKTGEGRALVLIGPLRPIIDRRLKARRLDCPLIFHRASKGKEGQPVKDIRQAWAAACKLAGLKAGRDGGLTVHDLRRTAVRNMVRAGVDPTIAMRVSGHKTRSMFDRYNIVSEEDLRAAVEKTALYVSTLPTERKVASIAGAVVAEDGPNTDQSRPARATASNQSR